MWLFTRNCQYPVKRHSPVWYGRSRLPCKVPEGRPDWTATQIRQMTKKFEAAKPPLGT